MRDHYAPPPDLQSTFYLHLFPLVLTGRALEIKKGPVRNESEVMYFIMNKPHGSCS